MGIAVMNVCVSFSRSLAHVAVGLDKRPDLLASLQSRPALLDDLLSSESSAGEQRERVTLVESAANVIREAFKKCLAERAAATTAGLDPTTGAPAGRRAGIYRFANLCLRLFFHCGRPRSAEQIFANIGAQSPPLARFPAAQRVAFLYWLGRYHAANGHFPRAARALQAAYAQTLAGFRAQRARILTLLIAAHMLLGRFPSKALWSRPEAAALAQPAFLPLMQAIRLGDWAAFRTLTALPHPAAQWLLRRRLLLPVRSRGEVLLWRGLARRVFVVAGLRPTPDQPKRAATMDLDDLRIAMAALNAKAEAQVAALLDGEQDRAESWVDPDLAGADDPSEDEELDEESGGEEEDEMDGEQGDGLEDEADNDNEMDEEALPALERDDGAEEHHDEDPTGETNGSEDMASDFALCGGSEGETERTYNDDGDDDDDDDDADGSESDEDYDAPFPRPDVVAAGAAALVAQGLLRGYVAHRHAKFVVRSKGTGKDPLEVGFPSVWSVLGAGEGQSSIDSEDTDDGSSTAAEEDGVPGWVQDEDRSLAAGGNGKVGAGTVINLKGARPVGAAG